MKRTVSPNHGLKWTIPSPPTASIGHIFTKQFYWWKDSQFIIDNGSPITILPPTINPKKLTRTKRCFVNVNKNPIKFKGEAFVEVKTENSEITLPILITENINTQPLLGLDLLDKLEIGLQGTRNANAIRNKTMDKRSTKILNNFEDLFKNNHTIEGLTIDIELKKDTKPIQQKRRPVPIHFQNSVRDELEKLIEKGHPEKADGTTENCIVSPAVITIKKDKLVKIALGSRKWNESCIKRKAAMPNMKKLISNFSAKITMKNGRDGCRRSIWIMLTDKPNYPRKPRSIVYFPKLVATPMATTVSRKASTDSRIFQPSFKDTSTKYWNLKHQYG